MAKFIRTFLAIFLLLGLALLAKNRVARAASSTAGSDPASSTQAAFSESPGGDEDCNQDNNRNKDKCKDKDKCKKKDGDCGTVKPPDDDFDICERGDYSVGGAATVNVDKLQDRSNKHDCLHAQSESSEGLQGLPKETGPVLSDQILLTSVGQGSTIRICFAAAPGKNVKIYSHEGGSWKPVGTQVKNGMACAQVQVSGSYVLAGK